METAERSTPPIERAPQASDAETPRSAEPRRPAAAPVPPPAPVPKNPQPAARTFTRRYVLDVPLYTAPLALLLLGLGWQIIPGEDAGLLPLLGLAGLGLAAATVVVQRLLPPETLQENAPPPRLWALVAFLVFAPIGSGLAVAITGPALSLADHTGTFTILFITLLLVTTTIKLVFFGKIHAYNMPYLFEIAYSTILVYYGVGYTVFEYYIFTTAGSIGFIVPSIILIRNWEISNFINVRSSILLSFYKTIFIISIYYYISWNFYNLMEKYLLLFAILSLFILVSIIYMFKFPLKRLIGNSSYSLTISDGITPLYKTYSLIPSLIILIILIFAVDLLSKWPTSNRSSMIIEMTAWPVLLGYTFLFASPLPRLLLEAELRGAPVPGASYADFRRLSRLGVSDDLARRGARAIVAAALAGLARGLRGLPAFLAPWIAVTLALSVVLLPWPLWLGGASPAPLILPIAVWAAARWGRRALPPLAVVLVPHAIGLSLPVQDGNALPQLLGAPGFVAATLFWARFTADADLRRRLLTQERFGAGALLALALLAGCVTISHLQSASGLKATLILNLLWPAASLVLVWGLSRAPIGGAVAVLLLLVGLRAVLHALGWSPQALAAPLQLTFGNSALIVDPPLFGLTPQLAAGLVLLALLARFAVRQGLLPDARRATRFSSPLSRTVGAALTIMLAVASLDLSAGKDIAGTTLDATAPQEPFLLAIGFILGLWLARPLRHLPGDLILGWAPLGVVIGVALVVFLKPEGGASLAGLLDQLGSPYAIASLAAFIAFVVFGYLVRRTAEGRRRKPESRTTSAHTGAPREGQAVLYAGPSAVLDDLLGRDRRAPLARVIDATFAEPEARRLKDPGVTAPMLADAAPRPFAEVFELPTRAAPSPAGLVLGRLGMLFLALNAFIAVAAVTVSARQATAPLPTETTGGEQQQQQQQQQQPATTRDSGGKAPPSAR